jgi:hypothetical protein
MEPFTLFVWLWMGQRFEQTQIENMGGGDCVERKVAIEADRAFNKAKGQCIDAGGYVLPMDRPPAPPCAHLRCGLSAWRRV